MARGLRRLELLERIYGGVQDQDGPADRTYAWRLDKRLGYAVTSKAFRARDDNTHADVQTPNQVRHATHSDEFGSDRFWISLNAHDGFHRCPPK
jgi:hypothetical protein